MDKTDRNKVAFVEISLTEAPCLASHALHGSSQFTSQGPFQNQDVSSQMRDVLFQLSIASSELHFMLLSNVFRSWSPFL